MRETSKRRRSVVLTVRVMSPSRSIRSSSRVMPLRLSASATTMEAVSSCSGSVPDGAQARWTSTSNCSRLSPAAARSRRNWLVIRAVAHCSCFQAASWSSVSAGMASSYYVYLEIFADEAM